MRGSDVNWPADSARDGAPDRTGGSRMLLDELLAQREHVEISAPPAPRLTIEPVAVPGGSDVGRRAVRQRLVELEEVARRNLRSAEEARRVLGEEHRRLEHESAARARSQDEAAALRRELERLRDTDRQRARQEKARALRVARAELAAELREFHDEHDRVLRELDQLRGSLGEHDGLIEEYSQRLREEQQARATMRAELDRAEAERRLAERALERAMETAKQRAEDELIHVAGLEAQLKDARSDCERVRKQLAEREEELAQLRAQIPVSALGGDAAPPPLARRRRRNAATEPTATQPLLPIRRKGSSEESSRRAEMLTNGTAPTPSPAAAPTPAAPARRSVMAELTAIATARD